MYLSRIDNQWINNRLSFAVHHFDTATGGRNVIKPSDIREAVTTVLYPRVNAWVTPSRLLLPRHPSCSPAPGLPGHPPADQRTESLPNAATGVGLYWA